VLAFAVALLALPIFLNSPAFAEGEDAPPPPSATTGEEAPPQSDPAAEAEPDAGSDPEPSPEAPAEEPAQEPAAEEPPAEAPPAEAPEAPETGIDAGQPTTQVSAGKALAAGADQLEAMLVTDPIDCMNQTGTNLGTGNVSNFQQNTQEDAGGTWVNGALNQNNSSYAENDFVPQRVVLTGIQPGLNQLVFSFDMTKNTKYAYDFVDHLAVLNEPGVDISWDAPAGTPPVSLPSYDNVDGTATVIVTVTFDVPDGTDGNMTIRFDAHIASELDYGPNSGAGSISGAPYHVSLSTLNCDPAGSMDNQLMSDAVDAGTITVVKDAVPNSAQDFEFSIVPGGAASQFFLDDDADGTLPNSVSFHVAPGVYDVSELNLPQGWSLTGINCVVAGGNSSATNLPQNKVSVTVVDNGTATCTFTNGVVQPKLTLVKNVVNGSTGGTAVPSNWTLSADGPTDFSGAGNSAAVTNQSVQAGSYDLSESGGPGGYTASDWVCVGGNQVDGDTVSLANGDNVTCTITNTAQAAQLTLIKDVVNGTTGGTAVPGDWTLSADGPTDFSGAGNSAAVTDVPVAVGAYDLSESGGPGGYTASDWTCTGGTQDDANTVTIGLGQDVTCTITNTARQPHLTLVKIVDNGDTGATADSGDWTLSADGPTDFSGAGNSQTIVSVPVQAGSYDLSESGGPGGYSASDWTCTGGTQDDADTVTIGLGQDVTCTITNTAQVAELTLVKVVANGDTGAGNDAGDWTLTATGPTPVSGAGDSPNIVNQPVQIGSYDLSEDGPGGYDASSWVCTGGNQTDGDTVSIGLGDDVTCTITNTAQQPLLTLVKVVDNGDTGADNDAADWTLSAAGPTPVSGAGGSAAVVNQFVAVGSYDLSEDGPSGYDASDWVCTGGDQTDADSVTIGLGDVVTCTVTNTARQPELTLVKLVNNGNTGGTADSGDWTLSADGPTPVSGAGDSTTIVDVPVEIGSYDLSESGGPAGYDASNWVCVGATQDDSDTVTIGLGDDVTCTITNVAQPAELTLVKVVENGTTGADNVAGDWTLTADGPTQVSGAGNSGAVTDVPVMVGSYDLSESGPDGYDASSWVCTGGTQDDGDTVTIGLDQDVTCTITNTAQQPELTLIKVVDNGDSGADNDASDWTLSADGPTQVSGAGGSVDVIDVPVAIGDYDLSESGPAGYDASAWDCTGGEQVDDNTVEIGLGDDVVCTVTNTAVTPSLTLVKDVDHNGTGDDAVDTDFTLTATGPAAISGEEGDPEITGADVPIGTYELTEVANVAGYELLEWVCTGDAAVDHDDNGTPGNADDDSWSVTVGLGDDVTCEAFNRATPSDWIVEKSSDPVSGSTVLPGDEIHYTVTVTRVGDGVNVFDVDVIDTLTGIDLAWVSDIQVSGNAFATPGAGSITLHINELSNAVVMTYTVTVGEVWDAELKNVVTPGSQPCVDPDPSDPFVECDETTHFTPHWVLDKSVELLATPGDDDGLAEPGEHLTYTLELTNDTEHAIVEDVEVTDSLADVLDNATMVDSLAELAGKGLTLVGTDLTWTVAGPVQPGQTVSVTYTVEINAHAFDVTLHNIATPAPGDGGECIPAGDLGPGDDTAECETETVTPPVTTMVIEKQDFETGEVLAGAEFALYLDNAPDNVDAVGPEDVLIETATTDASGQVKFEELQKGEYLVEETTPPAGYTLPDNPVLQVTIDDGNFVRGGEMTPIVFRDPTTGQIAIVAKQQFEFIDGEWEESDGLVDFGDVVKYVVNWEATGPRNFYGVELSDFVPGSNEVDSTTTRPATLVADTAACTGELPCVVTAGDDGRITWQIGDVFPANGGTITGAVEFVVEFPQAPDAPVFVDGLHTDFLWNQGYLDYDEVVGGTPEVNERAGNTKAKELVLEHHTLASNEVVVSAELEEEPIEPNPPNPPDLPDTGAQAYLGQLAILGGLILALGVALAARNRRKGEQEAA
jgi:uncharacterized repeat protein (TIGR01451 family)